MVCKQAPECCVPLAHLARACFQDRCHALEKRGAVALKVRHPAGQTGEVTLAGGAAGGASRVRTGWLGHLKGAVAPMPMLGGATQLAILLAALLHFRSSVGIMETFCTLLNKLCVV